MRALKGANFFSLRFWACLSLKSCSSTAHCLKRQGGGCLTMGGLSGLFFRKRVGGALAMTAASSSEESSPRLKRTIVAFPSRALQLFAGALGRGYLALFEPARTLFSSDAFEARLVCVRSSRPAARELRWLNARPQMPPQTDPYHRGIRYLQARTDTFTRRGPLRRDFAAPPGSPDAVGALPLTRCASYLSRARTSERDACVGSTSPGELCLRKTRQGDAPHSLDADAF